MTNTAPPAAVPIPRTVDTTPAAALRRLADALRGAGLTTGLVLRVDASARRSVQVLRDGEVVRDFTPEQVLNAHPAVLLHMIRNHGVAL